MRTTASPIEHLREMALILRASAANEQYHAEKLATEANERTASAVDLRAQAELYEQDAIKLGGVRLPRVGDKVITQDGVTLEVTAFDTMGGVVCRAPNADEPVCLPLRKLLLVEP